jgi:hypothetical protein
MTPQQIRDFLASPELSEVATCDMPDADLAWHFWCQKEYRKEKETWEKLIKRGSNECRPKLR